jgi:hypothetical protein
MDDLFAEVAEALRRRRGEWRKIADDLRPAVSYSWITKVGADDYASEPSYRRLLIVRDYLRTGQKPPKKRKRAA